MSAMSLVRLALLLACALFAGCSNLTYTYQYVPGKTATTEGDYAVAPEGAPEQVQAAIAAGNQIVGAPYRRGGGHGRSDGGCYDCSGAVSYVLRNAGLLRDSMPSKGFRRYGHSGAGEWISVWAEDGHVFLTVAGLRFDTGWHGNTEGPRWTTKSRPARGYVMRHPAGL
jgi:hypothetical protein